MLLGDYEHPLHSHDQLIQNSRLRTRHQLNHLGPGGGGGGGGGMWEPATLGGVGLRTMKA